MTALKAAPESLPETAGESVRQDSYFLWRVLAIAMSAQVAGSLVSQGVYTLVPFWKSAFNLSQGEAALAVTFMNAGQICSMFVLGRAIDRYGERIVVAITMLAMALMAVLAAYIADQFIELLLFMLVLGGFYAAVQPGGTRAIMRWFPPHRRGLATGFRQAAVPIGTAAAAFLLPMLAFHFGWRSAMLAQAAVGVLGAGLFWFFYHDDEVLETKSSASTQSIPIIMLIRILHHTPGFWPVLAAGVAMSAFQFTVTAHAISFLSEHFKVAVLAGAGIFSLAQLMGIPGRILLPWLTDHTWPGYRSRSLGWIMLAAGCSAVLLTVLPQDAPVWLVTMGFILFGLFGIGWFPLYVLQVAEMAPRQAIAATVSFATTFCMIAMTLAPFGFGIIVDWTGGYRLAWLVLVAPVFLSSLLLLENYRKN